MPRIHSHYHRRQYIYVCSIVHCTHGHAPYTFVHSVNENNESFAELTFREATKHNGNDYKQTLFQVERCIAHIINQMVLVDKSGKFLRCQTHVPNRQTYFMNIRNLQIHINTNECLFINTTALPCVFGLMATSAVILAQHHCDLGIPQLRIYHHMLRH